MIRNARRGRHKIYLGYCAGVGKTTQMLKEAQRLKTMEKLDVVIGFVETHSRAETAACKEDMEEVPRRKIVYRNIEITEMDVPAILARHPPVVFSPCPCFAEDSGFRQERDCIALNQQETSPSAHWGSFPAGSRNSSLLRPARKTALPATFSQDGMIPAKTPDKPKEPVETPEGGAKTPDEKQSSKKKEPSQPIELPNTPPKDFCGNGPPPKAETKRI